MGSALSVLANAWNLYDSTGYAVRPDPSDAGVLRAYRRDSGMLVGLVVVRDGRIAYAEHDRVVFAFFPSDTPSRQENLARDWRLTVRESAAS